MSQLRRVNFLMPIAGVALISLALFWHAARDNNPAQRRLRGLMKLAAEVS
ncbi:hypothetical protein [Chromobacterium sp. IIBBL 290-4]|nr:hypothetical protein [Chromobacterium sp. IIBBL 290-4]UTH74655.1 hypothetical protein NKT35_00630 [Chromobacterium sp. IIBBL 290-4]